MSHIDSSGPVSLLTSWVIYRSLSTLDYIWSQSQGHILTMVCLKTLLLSVLNLFDVPLSALYKEIHKNRRFLRIRRNNFEKENSNIFYTGSNLEPSRHRINLTNILK
jgi:hypothetical protein